MTDEPGGEKESAAAYQAPTPVETPQVSAANMALPGSAPSTEGVQITGVSPTADQAPTPQLEQPAAAQQPSAQGAEKAKDMVTAGLIKDEDLVSAQTLTAQEVAQLSPLLKSEAISKDQVSEFLKLSPDQRQERYQREVFVDMLIKDGIFPEEDRAELREQPADDLKYYYDQGTPDNDAENPNVEGFHPSEGKVLSVAEAREKDLSDFPEVIPMMFDWTKRGGTIDQAVGKVEAEALLQAEDQKLDAEVEAYWNNRANVGEDELKRLHLDSLSGENQKAAFLAAYKAQRLDDPEYTQPRDARIAAEVQGKVDLIRGLVLKGPAKNPDGTENTEETAKVAEAQKGLWQKLKEASPALAALLVDQLVKAGESTAEQLLDNDFGAFLRMLLLSGGSYSRDRLGGSIDAQGNKLVSMEEFANVAGKPEDMGKVLTDVYRNEKFLQAGFNLAGQDMEAVKNGDPAAIRELMKNFLNDLFGGTTEELNKRWAVAKVIFPEMMYPGKKVNFDDMMKEKLKGLHESIGVTNGAFEKTFPAAETASGAEAPETEPGQNVPDIEVVNPPASQQAPPQAA